MLREIDYLYLRVAKSEYSGSKPPNLNERRLNHFTSPEMSSVDRYVAITRPLRYKSLITYHVSYFMIGMVWVVCAVLAMFPLVGEIHCHITVASCVDYCLESWDIANSISISWPFIIVDINDS